MHPLKQCYKIKFNEMFGALTLSSTQIDYKRQDIKALGSKNMTSTSTIHFILSYGAGPLFRRTPL